MVVVALLLRLPQRPAHWSWGSVGMAKVAEHRFDGRVAVITGAGNGLGRQHALELARRGARVVVNDIGSDADGRPAAERVAAEIRSMGGEAAADSGSMANEHAAEALIQRAVTTFGVIDILVNNAGNAITKPIWKLSTDDLKRVLDVHLFGTFWSMRAAPPRVRPDREHGFSARCVRRATLGALRRGEGRHHRHEPRGIA